MCVSLWDVHVQSFSKLYKAMRAEIQQRCQLFLDVQGVACYLCGFYIEIYRGIYTNLKGMGVLHPLTITFTTLVHGFWSIALFI
jgi:hypothetical protein